MEKNDKVISIRLPQKTLKDLKKKAKEEKRSVSSLCRIIIESFVKDEK